MWLIKGLARTVHGRRHVYDNIYIYLYYEGLAYTKECWSGRRSRHRNSIHLNKRKRCKSEELPEQNSVVEKYRCGREVEIASMQLPNETKWTKRKRRAKRREGGRRMERGRSIGAMSTADHVVQTSR